MNAGGCDCRVRRCCRPLRAAKVAARMAATAVKAVVERERRRSPSNEPQMLDAVNAASVGGAGATVHVAAESVHGASEPNDLSRWARVRAKRSPEWTDRTLGAHAGSTVGCVRRLGSGGVGARAGRANGRFAFAR